MFGVSTVKFRLVGVDLAVVKCGLRCDTGLEPIV